MRPTRIRDLKMKRLVLMIFLALSCGFVFSSCEKNEDYDKLEGTTWETEVDNDGMVLSLWFENDSTCVFGGGRIDGGHTFIPTVWSWRYASLYDSMGGLFFIYNMAFEERRLFSGTVENKKLYIHFHDEVLCFVRKK